MLLHRVWVAEASVSALEHFRDDFHASDKKLAVLQERVEGLQAVDKLKNALLAVGSLFMGFIPSSWPNVALSALLFVAGAVFIFVSWHRPDGER